MAATTDSVSKLKSMTVRRPCWQGQLSRSKARRVRKWQPCFRMQIWEPAINSPLTCLASPPPPPPHPLQLLVVSPPQCRRSGCSIWTRHHPASDIRCTRKPEQVPKARLPFCRGWKIHRGPPCSLIPLIFICASLFGLKIEENCVCLFDFYFLFFLREKVTS